MRALTALAAVMAITACAQPPTPPEHGKLSPHREAIVEALELRQGRLSATLGNTIQPCVHYWASGDPDRAEIDPASCTDGARIARARLSKCVGVEASLDDARDPALWRFVAAREHF